MQGTESEWNSGLTRKIYIACPATLLSSGVLPFPNLKGAGRSLSIRQVDTSTLLVRAHLTENSEFSQKGVSLF